MCSHAPYQDKRLHQGTGKDAGLVLTVATSGGGKTHNIVALGLLASHREYVSLARASRVGEYIRGIGK